MTLAAMLHPSFLRLYRDAALRVATGELTVLFPPALDPREVAMGGVPYMCFDLENALPNDMDGVLRILSQLTFAHALFAVEGDTLRPLDKNAVYYLDESLSSLLKYTGKTNERFTRLLLQLATLSNAVCRKLSTTVNVTAQAVTSTAPAALAAPLRILDPLAGKGTTLFEALMHGHHAYGIEADTQYPAEADRYLKKFLETARYKFITHQERISGTHPQTSPHNTSEHTPKCSGAKSHGAESKPQKFTATRHQVTLAPDKEAMKSNPRQFEIIHGDTRHAAHFYKKHFFDAIVADLPYGVQHGASPGAKKPSGSITRNAAQLLQEALPQWRKVIKNGGTIVLSWNRFLIPRAQMEALLEAHGFAPSPEVAALDFSHRVDQAIDRDVIVGVTTL